MLYTLRTWRRLVYRTLFKRQEYPPEQRRSPVFCLLFAGGFLAFKLFTSLHFLIDEVLFRGYRRVQIRAPIFVIGNPRSGTTLLHRVLAKDRGQFFFFYTWQILYPAVVQKKIWNAVGFVDRLLGSPGRRVIEWFESKQEYNLYHQVGNFLPEEDDKLLLHILALADFSLLFPAGGFERMAKFDVDLGREEQDLIVDFYSQCIRRQAYAVGGSQKTLLSKNPFFSGRVETLLRRFPDSRFIYMVRNPLDVIPSAINLARFMIRFATSKDPGPEFEEHAYELFKYYYSYPLERLAELPPERFLIVNYEELLREPKEVFTRVYRQFGIPLTPKYEAQLDAEIAEMRNHKSRHKYSLQESVVTRDRIVVDLRPIFDRFGFDTREPAPAPAEAPSAT